jgi:hypothetical protein
VRDCIRENWQIRESYWPSYHFHSMTKGRKLLKLKAYISISIMGGDNEFVNKCKQIIEFDIGKINSALETFEWLTKNEL